MFTVVKRKPAGSLKKDLVVVVSAKVSKKATERNLVRRRIKSIARPLTARSRGGYVVIAKPEIKGASFKELEEELKNKMDRY